MCRALVPAVLAVILAAPLAALPARASATPPPLTLTDVSRFTRAPVVAAAAAPAAAAEVPEGGCALSLPGAGQATTATCVACHPRVQTHPVDLDYGSAAARSPSAYARAEDVVRAGVFLPDGQLRCVTCHDGSSPWRYKLALPPSATPSPSVAVLERIPGGLEQPPPAAPLPPGSDVSPTPLCRACHLF